MATVATKPSLTIKRGVKAPAEKVFAAWTDPEKVKRWMGPGERKPLRVESDPPIGGRYRWLMQAPGGEQHDVSGVYREVIPNEKLVFTWAWKSTPERESLVTVTFKRDGDGTFTKRLPTVMKAAGPARWKILRNISTHSDRSFSDAAPMVARSLLLERADDARCREGKEILRHDNRLDIRGHADARRRDLLGRQDGRPICRRSVSADQPAIRWRTGKLDGLSRLRCA